MTDDDAARVEQRKIRGFVLVVVAAGMLVQLVLSAYYLGAAHSPSPRHLPVGFVTTPDKQAAIAQKIDEGGQFKARPYGDDDAMVAAIKRKQIYGGVDLRMQQPHLFLASAAGSAAASTIRTAFTSVVQQQVSQQVEQLVVAGKPVPPTVVQSLTQIPAVTDVTPLPVADRSGGSLGLLVQALALGATVASLGLGRLRGKTSASIRRGIGHVTTLVVYAIGSALAVLLMGHAYGVVPQGSSGRLFLDFLLLSLAITGSTAGFVAIFGPLGAMAGTAYFTLGVIISGSSVLPEFLPTWGRIIGQVLPTGAGVTAIRESLYFPDANSLGSIAVLVVYATFGVVTVLITNALAHRTSRTAELPLPGT